MKTTEPPSGDDVGEHGKPSEAWLRRIYVEEQQTILDIASLTGAGKSSVFRWLQQYGISTLERGPQVDAEYLTHRYVVEQQSAQVIADELGLKRAQIDHLIDRLRLPRLHPKRRDLLVITPDWLRQKYIVEGLSFRQLTELTGHGDATWTRLCHRFGIATRFEPPEPVDVSRDVLYQMHVVEGLTAVRIAAQLKCHNSTISRLIRKYRLDPGRQLVNIPVLPPLNRDELWKLYWVDLLSTGGIAGQYGVSKATAQRWFRQLDVPRRKWNGGDFNPRKGFRSTGPVRRFGLEFDARERESIISRDAKACRMPGCGSKDQLEVHHILPIKYGGTNASENGLTLCHRCHESIKYREMDFVTLFQSLVNPQS